MKPRQYSISFDKLSQRIDEINTREFPFNDGSTEQREPRRSTNYVANQFVLNTVGLLKSTMRNCQSLSDSKIQSHLIENFMISHI